MLMAFVRRHHEQIDPRITSAIMEHATVVDDLRLSRRFPITRCAKAASIEDTHDGCDFLMLLMTCGQDLLCAITMMEFADHFEASMLSQSASGVVKGPNEGGD